MIEFTEENFNELVINSKKLVIVDFWADWCRPCHMIAPVLEEISSENEDIVTLGKVNVDKQPKISIQYGIRNIPTLLFFKNGEIVDKQVGSLINKKEMLEKIKKYI